MRAADLIKRPLRWAGTVFPPDPASRVVVLCYHSIHPSLPYRSASPQLFSDHLAWLREHCSCVPFGEVLAHRDAGRSDRPVVAITFDDGYADNHEFALPALARAGIPATFFLTAGLVERDPRTLERFRQLRGVDRESIQPIRWGQVQELLRSGMEVGAHTYTHPNLARLDDAQLDDELTRSKRIVEERLGCAISMMAYPFGRPRAHFTDRVVASVRRAGYTLAAAVVTRGVTSSDSPLSVPRIYATGDSVEVLRDKVFGVWDLIGTLRERMPLAVSRVVSPADFRF